MKRRRHTMDEVVRKLREAEALERLRLINAKQRN